MNEEWQKIYSKRGKLMYGGFVRDGKPCGAGVSYYSNGKTCQEGVFDRKGLVYGREYYRNGNLRFEGAYKQNLGYGPNFPMFGSCYDEDGREYFYGELTIKRIGSMFFPVVEKPECYGDIATDDQPDLYNRVWHRKNRKPRGKYFVKISDRKARKDFVELLERNGFTCNENGESGKESTIDSKFSITIDIGRKEYGHIGNTTCVAAATTSGMLLSVKEFLSYYEIVNSIMIV